jgi:hypothetical protein
VDRRRFFWATYFSFGILLDEEKCCCSYKSKGFDVSTFSRAVYDEGKRISCEKTKSSL